MTGQTAPDGKNSNLDALPYFLDSFEIACEAREWLTSPPTALCAGQQLGTGLLKLLNACRANQADLIGRTHGQLRTGLDRLDHAAQGFQLGGGTRLSDVFWTAPHFIWNGSVARALTAQRSTHSNFAGAGYAVLFCTTVSNRALFWSKASPLTVRDRIAGTFCAGGPYLVLLRLEQDPFGEVTAACGYAQSILDHSCFIPVSISSERTLLKILFALQDRLDDFGWEISIARKNAGILLSPCIDVCAKSPDGRILRFSTLWGNDPDRVRQPCDHAEIVLTVNERDMVSGQFVQRLTDLFDLFSA